MMWQNLSSFYNILLIWAILINPKYFIAAIITKIHNININAPILNPI
jgi:hypothetical protein